MKRFVIFSLAVLTTGLSTVPAFSEDLIPTALSFDLCPFSRSNETITSDLAMRAFQASQQASRIAS